MKINLKSEKGLDFCDPWRCPIAKALKRRWIIPFITLNTWGGLFLGFIPVWGTIPRTTNKTAQELCDENMQVLGTFYVKQTLNLYDRKSTGGTVVIVGYLVVILSVIIQVFLKHKL